MELRPRQPQSSAEERLASGSPRSVVAGGGRHRRRGARRPRPVAGGRRSCDWWARTVLGVSPSRAAEAEESLRTSWSRGWATSVRSRTPCSAATGRWRTRCLSAPMNLGLLDPLHVVETRRGRARVWRGAAPERRGVRAPDHRLARLRLAPVLVPRRGLPHRQQRAGCDDSASRGASCTSTPTRSRRTACTRPSTACGGTAGPTTSSDSWCSATGRCSTATTRSNSTTGSSTCSSTERRG